MSALQTTPTPVDRVSVHESVESETIRLREAIQGAQRRGVQKNLVGELGYQLVEQQPAQQERARQEILSLRGLLDLWRCFVRDAIVLGKKFP